MSRPSEERDAPAAALGIVARTELRLIDACLHFLQRLRGHVAPEDGRDRHRSHADSGHAAVAETQAPAPRPSLLRLVLVGLICLLLGGGAGALLSYRELSQQLAEHGGVVERMQEDLDAARKEEAHNVKLLDRFQRESAEYRRETREAQHEVEVAKDRVAELEAQIEEIRQEQAQRAEQAAREARRTAALAERAKQTKPQRPAKTGNCAVGNGEDVSACIEKFNR
jgi:hypothetical protein